MADVVSSGDEEWDVAATALSHSNQPEYDTDEDIRTPRKMRRVVVIDDSEDEKSPVRRLEDDEEEVALKPRRAARKRNVIDD